jgi:hypothetical protein
MDLAISTLESILGIIVCFETRTEDIITLLSLGKDPKMLESFRR